MNAMQENQVSGGAIILDTPEKIVYAQFVTQKAALRLEAAGMRHSRLGRGMAKLVANTYGFPKEDRTSLLARMSKVVAAVHSGETFKTALEANGGHLPS